MLTRDEVVALLAELGQPCQVSTFDLDGAAAIISELIGLAGRASPDFLEMLLARVEKLP